MGATQTSVSASTASDEVAPVSLQKPALQSAHSVSVVVVPTVDVYLPTGQLACALQTALLLAENWPFVHATQLLSAVVEPMVQKDPAPQLAAFTFVQLSQFAVTESANVPALQAAHEPAAVEEAPLNRGA